jgi:hypothetical protein
MSALQTFSRRHNTHRFTEYSPLRSLQKAPTLARSFFNDPSLSYISSARQ